MEKEMGLERIETEPEREG